MTYLELYEKYNFPASIIAVASGRLTVPDSSFKAYRDWLVHPPALLPILVNEDWPSILSYLSHPFRPRNGSFVLTYLDSDYLTLEKALNAEQLFSHLILESIEVNDGVSEEIKKFAQETGTYNLEEIDKITLEESSGNGNLSRLATFQNNLPLSLCKSPSQYRGDFPSNEQFIIPANLQNCSNFEIADKSKLAQFDNVPEWLVGEVSNQELFQYYLNRGELNKAWFTLNSSGWPVADLARAVEQMQAKATDPYLNDICQVWLDDPFDAEQYY